MDLTALTWNIDQSDMEEVDAEDCGRADLVVDSGGGVDGVGTALTEATLWMRGSDPFGILTNWSTPLTCAIVS